MTDSNFNLSGLSGNLKGQNPIKGVSGSGGFQVNKDLNMKGLYRVVNTRPISDEDPLGKNDLVPYSLLLGEEGTEQDQTQEGIVKTNEFVTLQGGNWTFDSSTDIGNYLGANEFEKVITNLVTDPNKIKNLDVDTSDANRYKIIIKAGHLYDITFQFQGQLEDLLRVMVTNSNGNAFTDLFPYFPANNGAYGQQMTGDYGGSLKGLEGQFKGLIDTRSWTENREEEISLKIENSTGSGTVYRCYCSVQKVLENNVVSQLAVSDRIQLDNNKIQIEETQAVSNIPLNMSNNKLTNLAQGFNSTDAITKQQLDSFVPTKIENDVSTLQIIDNVIEPNTNIDMKTNKISNVTYSNDNDVVDKQYVDQQIENIELDENQQVQVYKNETNDASSFGFGLLSGAIAGFGGGVLASKLTTMKFIAASTAGNSALQALTDLGSKGAIQQTALDNPNGEVATGMNSKNRTTFFQKLRNAFTPNQMQQFTDDISAKLSDVPEDALNSARQSNQALDQLYNEPEHIPSAAEIANQNLGLSELRNKYNLLPGEELKLQENWVLDAETGDIIDRGFSQYQIRKGSPSFMQLILDSKINSNPMMDCYQDTGFKFYKKVRYNPDSNIQIDDPDQLVNKNWVESTMLIEQGFRILKTIDEEEKVSQWAVTTNPLDSDQNEILLTATIHGNQKLLLTESNTTTYQPILYNSSISNPDPLQLVTRQWIEDNISGGGGTTSLDRIESGENNLIIDETNLTSNVPLDMQTNDIINVGTNNFSLDQLKTDHDNLQSDHNTLESQVNNIDTTQIASDDNTQRVVTTNFDISCYTNNQLRFFIDKFNDYLELQNVPQVIGSFDHTSITNSNQLITKQYFDNNNTSGSTTTRTNEYVEFQMSDTQPQGNHVLYSDVSKIIANVDTAISYTTSDRLIITLQQGFKYKIAGSASSSSGGSEDRVLEITPQNNDHISTGIGNNISEKFGYVSQAVALSFGFNPSNVTNLNNLNTILDLTNETEPYNLSLFVRNRDVDAVEIKRLMFRVKLIPDNQLV